LKHNRNNNNDAPFIYPKYIEKDVNPLLVLAIVLALSAIMMVRCTGLENGEPDTGGVTASTNIGSLN